MLRSRHGVLLLFDALIGPTARTIGRIAGVVQEFALFLAARTGVWAYRRSNQKSTVAALPVSQAASGADITGKITG